MENYKQRLTEQAKALQTDIDKLVEQVTKKEEELDELKEAKSLAQRELRGIEKKLAKL